MTPRPRKRSNAALPPNLYAANGGKSFRYRHPLTGKHHGMGPNKLEAIKAAKELNSLLVGESDLVQSVLGRVTLAAHIAWFQEHTIPERDYKPSTIEMYQVHCRKLIRAYGNRPVEEVSVQDMVELMGEQTPRISNQLRQVSADVFKVAISRGLRAPGDNPAEVALKRKVKKARKRLTLEQFEAIKAKAEPWLKNAMDIGLITLQRRGDISRLRFEDVRDGKLYVIQEKTQKHDTGYLCIAVGPALERIIRRCRDDVVSPCLVHRKPIRKIKRADGSHWSQVQADMISRAFGEAREACKLFEGVPDKELPTFHEIRALGIKLYKDQGKSPQQLAGHADEQMTKNYDADHSEIRWVVASADLAI